MDTPVFVTCRDRFAVLLDLIDWLERHELQEIYLVDNDSRYPPLVEYFEKTPHRVISLGRNVGARSAWECGLIDQLARGRQYVATDCDILPAPDCPDDVLDRFRWVLRRYPEHRKVGFGLKIDDLPSHYRFADEVRGWEKQFWQRPLGPGLYHAAIDTTFALYRPDVPFGRRPSVRTGSPYLALHRPWYSDSDHPSAEDSFRRGRADPSKGFWEHDVLPPRVRTLVTAEQARRYTIKDRLHWRLHVLFKVKRAQVDPGLLHPNGSRIGSPWWSRFREVVCRSK